MKKKTAINILTLMTYLHITLVLYFKGCWKVTKIFVLAVYIFQLIGVNTFLFVVSTEKYKAIYPRSKCIGNFWGSFKVPRSWILLKEFFIIQRGKRILYYPERAERYFNFLTINKFTFDLYLVVLFVMFNTFQDLTSKLRVFGTAAIVIQNIFLKLPSSDKM